MKLRFWGWSLLGWLALLSWAHATLVTPPFFTSITLPPTALVNETVTVSATAQADYSDDLDPDGKEWNDVDQVAIHRITIWCLPPGEASWLTLRDLLLAPWTNPHSVSIPVTLSTPGEWLFQFQAGDGRPWLTVTPPYSIIVNPPPGPIITSALSLASNQGGYAWYQITATNSPTSFAAVGLPDGLSVETASGIISGHATVPGDFSATITATNANGSNSQTLTWPVYAASLLPNGSVDQPTSYLGTPITFIRDGTANFGVDRTQGTVWCPDGSGYVFGDLPLGSTTWTPDRGPGRYEWQFRLIDNNDNFLDQRIIFEVIAPTVSAPTDLQSFTTGSTFVTLNWGAGIAASGIDHYDIYRNGSLLTSTGDLSFTDSAVDPLTGYRYTVIAVDTQGNPSPATSTISVATLRALEAFTPLP